MLLAVVLLPTLFLRCARAAPNLQLSEQVVRYLPYSRGANLNGDRFFSVVGGCGPNEDEVWLFARCRGTSGLLVMSRSIDGGITFSKPSPVLQGDPVHNAAVVPMAPLLSAGPSAGPWLLLIGGRSIDPQRSEFSATEKALKSGVKAFALSRNATFGNKDVALPLFSPPGILNGGGAHSPSHCKEGRNRYKDWCEFDGRFSAVFWKGKYWLYSRLNVAWGKDPPTPPPTHNPRDPSCRRSTVLRCLRPSSWRSSLSPQ